MQKRIKAKSGIRVKKESSDSDVSNANEIEFIKTLIDCVRLEYNEISGNIRNIQTRAQNLFAAQSLMIAFFVSMAKGEIKATTKLETITVLICVAMITISIILLITIQKGYKFKVTTINEDAIIEEIDVRFLGSESLEMKLKIMKQQLLRDAVMIKQMRPLSLRINRNLQLSQILTALSIVGFALTIFHKVVSR